MLCKLSFLQFFNQTSILVQHPLWFSTIAKVGNMLNRRAFWFDEPPRCSWQPVFLHEYEYINPFYWGVNQPTLLVTLQSMKHPSFVDQYRSIFLWKP